MTNFKTLLLLVAIAGCAFAQQGTILTGTDFPSSGTCIAPVNVAQIYVRSEDPANGPIQVLRCTQTGFNAFAWMPIDHFVGGTLPTACAVGDIAYKTGVTAGQNLYGCTAANTWTLQAGGGGSGTVTNIATTGPITGGPITATGTIACATCGVTGSPLSQFAATTSLQLLGVISDETGTGALAFATSPTLVTPTLGAATATTVNKVTITAPASSATLTIPDGVVMTGPSTSGTVPITVFSGSTALGTSAISSGACATVVTVSATGVATTDVISGSFNGDPTGVTGYIPSTNGMLTIIVYPTTNNINIKVCNNTAASVTPGPITINLRDTR